MNPIESSSLAIPTDVVENENIPAALQKEDSPLPSSEQIIPKSPGLLQKVANFVKENKILIASGAAMAIGAGVILAAAVAGGPALLVFGALFFSLSSFVFVLAPFLDKEIDTALSQIFNQLPNQSEKSAKQLEHDQLPETPPSNAENVNYMQENFEERLEEEPDYEIEEQELDSQRSFSEDISVEDWSSSENIPVESYSSLEEIPVESYSSLEEIHSHSSTYFEEGTEEVKQEVAEESGQVIHDLEAKEQLEQKDAGEDIFSAEDRSLVETNSTSLQQEAGALQRLNRGDQLQPIAASRFDSACNSLQDLFHAFVSNVLRR